jgi:hypothetical protein
MSYWRIGTIVALALAGVLLALAARAGTLREPTTKADGSALTNLRDCEYVRIATPTTAPVWSAATKVTASSPAGGGSSAFPTDGETYAARCTRLDGGGTAQVSTTTVFTFRGQPPAPPDLSD